MFAGFRLETVEVAAGVIRVRYGGSGPPLLLLHGHPRTHTTWYRVAPLLARHFSVICPDLPGFGRSYIPRDSDDHTHSSKRAKAAALVDVMDRLGHRSFAVAGHDRGSYTAFRLAMDFPARVKKLAVLDGVPILEALERCRDLFARRWWHWFFYAQPAKPEQAIMADPLAWYGGDPGTMGSDNFADFREAVTDRAVVHGMLEDYRAGLSIDHLHDAQDRLDGRKLACPLLCLWSLRDDLPDLYGDVLAVWASWSSHPPSGYALPCGHHMAEEVPEELARALVGHFR